MTYWMNPFILLFFLRDISGFLFPFQAQSSNDRNCLCGFTCLVTVERCRQCTQTNCVTPPIQSNPIPQNFPSYQQAQLPQLPQRSYNLVTVTPFPQLSYNLVVTRTRPPMIAPQLRPRILPPRPYSLPPIPLNNWPPTPQIPSPPPPAPPTAPPLYSIQVPPSRTQTESNGLSETNKLFPVKPEGPEYPLHSADASSVAAAVPPPTSETSATDSITSTSTYFSDGEDYDGFSSPSIYNDRKPELGFTFSPSPEESTEPSSFTAASTAVDLSEQFFATESPGDTVTETVPHSTNLAEHDYNFDNRVDLSSNFFNPPETTANHPEQETTTTLPIAQSLPSPVLVETTHIEVYHPQGEHFPELTQATVPTTTFTEFSNEIEITSIERDPLGIPSTTTTSSHPLSSPIKEDSLFWMKAPDSPPRMNSLNQQGYVLPSSYGEGNANTYVTPSRYRAARLFERSSSHTKRNNKYARKSRGTGIAGKYHRHEKSGHFKKNISIGTTRRARKIKHEIGVAMSQTNASPRPKCNSVKLKRIMEQKMSLSTTISKQMIYSSVAMNFPGRVINVICSHHSFSYIVVTSPIYCEHRKARLTCFAFLQP